jgi:hypothetical protein
MLWRLVLAAARVIFAKIRRTTFAPRREVHALGVKISRILPRWEKVFADLKGFQQKRGWHWQC